INSMGSFGPVLIAPWSRLCLAFVILVVAVPPEAVLVASQGSAIEPLVHAPEAVQSASIGGISVMHHAVIEHKRAHAGPLEDIRRCIGSAHGSECRGAVGRRARDLCARRGQLPCRRL